MSEKKLGHYLEISTKVKKFLKNLDKTIKERAYKGENFLI